LLELLEARRMPTEKKEAMMKAFFSSSAYDWFAELLAIIMVSTRDRNVLSIRELMYAYVCGPAAFVGAGMEVARDAERFKRTTMFSAEMRNDVGWDYVQPQLCRAFDEKGEPLLVDSHERGRAPAGGATTAAAATVNNGPVIGSTIRYTQNQSVGGHIRRGQQGHQRVCCDERRLTKPGILCSHSSKAEKSHRLTWRISWRGVGGATTSTLSDRLVSTRWTLTWRVSASSLGKSQL
jgi:hypothetical protein